MKWAIANCKPSLRTLSFHSRLITLFLWISFSIRCKTKHMSSEMMTGWCLINVFPLRHLVITTFRNWRLKPLPVSDILEIVHKENIRALNQGLCKLVIVDLLRISHWQSGRTCALLINDDAETQILAAVSFWYLERIAKLESSLAAEYRVN